MRHSWTPILIVPLLLIAGCFSYGSRLEQQDVTPQSYEEKSTYPVIVAPGPIPTAENPAVPETRPVYSVFPPHPKAPDLQRSTPASGPVVAYATYSRTFKGQGIHYFNDTKALRFMSPFGVSAGEVITEAAKKPATISAGDTPTISMGADGSFKVGKGDDTKVVGTETGGNILGSIVTRVKDWGLIILVLVGAIIILPIFLPFLRPIFTVIWNTLVLLWGWFKGALAHLFQHVLPVAEGAVAWTAAEIAARTTPPVAVSTTTVPVSSVSTGQAATAVPAAVNAVPAIPQTVVAEMKAERAAALEPKNAV